MRQASQNLQGRRCSNPLQNVVPTPHSHRTEHGKCHCLKALTQLCAHEPNSPFWARQKALCQRRRCSGPIYVLSFIELPTRRV
jgi:hypothetical protein